MNQEDEHEKAHQVRLMGDIYKSCHRVLIYLAPDLFPNFTQEQLNRYVITNTNGYLRKAMWWSDDNLKVLQDILREYYNAKSSRTLYDKFGFQFTQMFAASQQSDLKINEYPLLARSRLKLGIQRRQQKHIFRNCQHPWLSFFLLFRHPWFIRGWTFQEYMLPPEAVFVIFGNAYPAEWIYTAHSQLNSLKKGQRTGKYADFLHDGFLQIALDHETRYRRKQDALGGNEPPGEHLSLAQQQLTKEVENRLFPILNETVPNNEVGQPQDLIYAFMGVIHETFHPPVDYSLPWTELFIHVTKAGIHSSGDLFIGKYLEREDGRKVDGRELLPSWTPNWTEAQTSGARRNAHMYDNSNANLNRHHLQHPEPNTCQLHTKGRAIGVVRVSQRFPPPDYEKLVMAEVTQVSEDRTRGTEGTIQAMAQVLDFLKAVHAILAENGLLPPQQTKTKGLLQTNLDNFATSVRKFHPQKGARYPPSEGNHTYHVVRQIVRLVEIDKSLIPYLEQNFQRVEYMADARMHKDFKSLTEEWDAFTSDAIDALWHKKSLDVAQTFVDLIFVHTYGGLEMFITNSGKMGYTHRQLMTGDLVCILHGSRMPMILRPSPEGTYTVVSVCFFDGAMFGEAVTWKEDEADEFILC